MTIEKKVGIFFVIGLVLLLIFTMTVEDIRIPYLTEETILSTSFPNIGDLRVGNTVTVRGMPAGRISKLSLKNNEIEVFFHLEKEINIPKDSKTEILMSSMLGGNYLNIQSGKSSKYCTNGDYLEGQEINSIANVVNSINQTSDKVQVLVDNLNKNQASFFASIQRVIEQNEEKIHTIITNMERGSGNIDKTFANMQKISAEINSGKGTLGKLIYQDELYQDAANITRRVEKLSRQLDNQNTLLGKLLYSEESGKQFEELMTELHEASGNINEITSENKEDLRTLIHNLSQASTDISELSANLNEVSAKLRAGDGTLGKLMTDEALYHDVRNLVNQMQAAIKNIEETMVNNSVLGVMVSGMK